MEQDYKKKFTIALISAPWAQLNRPSIQLAALAAYVRKNSRIEVETLHHFLAVAKAITIPVYNTLSLSGWAGEALYASLLFPSQREKAEKLFHTAKLEKTSANSFNTLVTAIERASTILVAQAAFNHVGLLGFSVCFNQLLPSLYLAGLIKKRYPRLPVVFGGSSCCGALGDSLIKTFPQIDYIIDGEGEETLLQLAQFLAKGKTELPPFVKTARKLPVARTDHSQLAMDKLPAPDYSGYFAEMHRLFPGSPFIPILPVEFSRGCWWNRCTFCNLNLQWQQYRQKPAQQMIAEVESLSGKHECLHFSFTDNTLPPREASAFFAALAATGKDYQFFAEIRAKTEPEELRTFRQGGLRTVQVGIESLSTSLLRRMKKGTTAMDNIAAMKACAAAGIRLEGNLIVEFPGTTGEEILETITHLDFVLPFSPLSCATFFLGFQSPVYQRGGEYGITRIIAHSKNRDLFPPNILDSMIMLVNDFHGQRRKLRGMWRPVRKKIAAWRSFHAKRTSQVSSLSYRDGGNFIIIRQEQVNGQPLLHRLRGISREVYLLCDMPRHINEISATYPNLSTAKLSSFLGDLTRKKLMFTENDTYLALAVRER